MAVRDNVVLLIFASLVVLTFMIRRDQAKEYGATIFSNKLCHDESAVAMQEMKTEAVFDQNKTLSNLHIAFMGDSISRYMYLSLAFYLRWGRWPGDNERPNFVEEKTFSDWNTFYFYTTMALSPYEQCDCFRRNDKHFLLDIRENRYFYDPVRNISLSIVLVLGSQYQIRGTLSPPQLLMHRASNFEQSITGPEHVWQIANNTNVLRNHIVKLEPKPQYLVLNDGFWPNNAGERLDEFLEILKEEGITGIYRTTTASKVQSFVSHEEAYCTRFPLCLNVSYTKDWVNNKTFQWDPLHWKSSVNRRFNLDLFELIANHKSVPTHLRNALLYMQGQTDGIQGI